MGDEGQGPGGRIYHPQLDGLRFVAFMLVFVHHAPALPLPLLRSLKAVGWIGVDLFLGLSAFLFVRLLSREFADTGGIKVGYFYVRRGLRIWPAYALFCALALRVDSGPAAAPLPPLRVVGLVTFTDNVLSAFQDYNPIPLTQHLWTISYEEQFYLVIPVALTVLLSMPRTRQLGWLAAAAAAGLAARATLILLQAPHPAIWVLPVTHFESILLGLALGLGAFDRWLGALHPAWSGLAGVACGALVACMPGVGTISWWLMPIYVVIGLGTTLVIHAALASGSVRGLRWLSSRPLGFLGKVSYGLYLFHLLAIQLGHTLAGRLAASGLPAPLDPAVLEFGLSLAIAVLMASTSYLAMEKPILRFKGRFEVVASRPH